MSDFKETPPSPIWVLYVFPNGKHGRICCRLADSSRVQKLPGRLVRLIILLQQAYLEDKRLPSDLKGFRSARDLAKVFDEDRWVAGPEPLSITSYLHKLCRLLNRPASGKSFPPLIERLRNCGARLLHPVEINFVGRTTSEIDTSTGSHLDDAKNG